MFEYHTRAIVLHKETMNEVDAKIILYTELLGKIELVAKGANKITAKLNCHLEILNLIETTLIIAANKHLTSALTINNFSILRHHEAALANAVKMVKFINQAIIASEKDEFLWKSLENYLSNLNQINEINKDNQSLYINLNNINFLIKLNTALGLMPDFTDLSHYFNKTTIQFIRFLKQDAPWQKLLKQSNLSNLKKIDYNKIENDLKQRIIL